MLSSISTWGVQALVFLSTIHLTSSAALLPRDDASAESTTTLPLTVNTVHEFSIPTWNENLAIRSNNQILVTRLDTPILMQVDPADKVPPITVYTFPSTHAGLLGITETTTNIFYVVAAAPFDGSFQKTSGNITVFKVDMRSFSSNAAGTITNPATVTKSSTSPPLGS
jgi:hypothetical protein